MNKAILAPIISGVALLIKHVTGYEMATAEQDIAVDAILGIVTLIGVFMHPKKAEKDTSQ